MTPKLVKMEGAGNDFLLGTGDWAGRLAGDTDLVRRLCDRHHGIGADGVLALVSDGPDRVRLQHRNADGSVSDFCGNGTRCAARAAVELEGCQSELAVVTGWAVIPASVRGPLVSLDLPAVTAEPRPVTVTVSERPIEAWYLLVGVPHVVVPVDDPAALDLPTVAPPLRKCAELGAGGANVNFVSAGGADPLAIRTWERGVEGETLSCGSGMVAAALVMMVQRGTTSLRLQPASGDVLTVEVLGEPPLCAVRFTGPTRMIGEIEPSDELLRSREAEK